MSTERSEPLVRSWPALDIHPVSELLQAALVDYDVTAVDERAPDDWRVFFTSARERDRAVAELRCEAVDLSLAAASRLIEKHLDGETDRKLVLEFLASLDEKR